MSTKTEKSSSKPTHTVSRKVVTGKYTEFEPIGVAWAREDGGLYIKLAGIQIIEGGFYAFPKTQDAAQEDGQ